MPKENQRLKRKSVMSNEKHIITWDLGASKCAAALVAYFPDNDHYDCLRRYSIKNAECSSLDDLVEHIEAGLQIKHNEVQAVVIGASGEYNGAELHHEASYPYKMDFARLMTEYHWPKTDIIHDYAPIICATFANAYMNDPANVRILNAGHMNPKGRRIATGVGTGLGMKDGVLLSEGDFWLGTNEVGYIGISMPPAADSIHLQRHVELIKFMRSEGAMGSDKLLSYENILSGRGCVLLHKFVKSDHTHITPEELGKQMREGDADETRQILAWYLGLFVGTLQLSFMPDGGLWITGGVVLKHPKIFDCSEFFDGIEASPSYWHQRQGFPLGVLQNPDHAFIGGAYYAVKRLIKV